MKVGLTVIFIAASQPAMAHCYSVWNYNYPQHCNAGLAQRQSNSFVNYRSKVQIPQPAPVHIAQTNPPPAVQGSHDWIVEVNKIPSELTEKELYAKEELAARERARFPELTDEEYEARKKAIEVLKEKMKQK